MVLGLLARGLRPLAPVKPLAANQVHYSLLHRKPETDSVLDASRRIDVALVAHRPIGRDTISAGSPAGAAGLILLRCCGKWRRLKTVKDHAGALPRR